MNTHVKFTLNDHTWYNEDLGSFLGSLIIVGSSSTVISMSSSAQMISYKVGLLRGSWSTQIRAISMHLFIFGQFASIVSCHCKVEHIAIMRA